MVRIVFRLGLTGVLLGSLAACGGGSDNNDTGLNSSLVSAQEAIAPGDECPDGGVRVKSGIDENGNGELEEDEVDVSEVVCHGQDGTNALVAMTGEPAGINCPSGGLRIDSGPDTNGNGVLDAAEITQTEFVCNGAGVVGWLAPEVIEKDPGEARTPVIAGDAAGNAIAVWAQYDGSRFNLWANRFEVGRGWGAPELIETSSTGDAQYPEIAMDTNGNAFVVWEQYDGVRQSIWVNRYVAGTGWGSAELVEVQDSHHSRSPTIAVDVEGNAIAVWHQFDGASTTSIYANRYTVGSGWGNARLVETDNTGQATSPSISADANGNFIVVWVQSDGTMQHIWANRYVAGSGWEEAQLIETDNSGSAHYPTVAVDVDGNAVAAWRQYNGTRFDIRANRYEVGSGWGSAELIGLANGYAFSNPSLAVDANGKVFAVWSESDGIQINSYSNIYDPESGWGAPVLIETNNASKAGGGEVAVDANGNAVVVWAQHDGHMGRNTNIWANRFVDGQGWGYAELIEIDAGRAVAPQIAVSATGNALAVWPQNDGMRYNIQAARFVNSPAYQ